MKPFKLLTAFLVVVLSICTFTLVNAKQQPTTDGYDFSAMLAYVRDCNSVNLRESPSITSDILCTISCDEQVIVTDQDGEWLKVEYDGLCGFVYWKYLKFKEYDLTDTILGSSIIHYKSAYNRDNNLSIACNKLNGCTIRPGEQFKWSEVIGCPSEENGYLQSNIILHGKYVPGIGGGICQVSTTLYNALLDTNIKPDVIYHHSLDCEYSKEHNATVVYGSKDFVFTNSYPFSIKIEALCYKSIVVVNLYMVK